MTILLRQKPLPQVVRQIVQRDNGAMLYPSDMTTMYQDAAGTTPVTAVEQPVGLVLDKSQGLMLGPELVSNGTFDIDATGWTAVLSSLTTNSGVIRVTNTATDYGFARQVINTVVGKLYEYKGVFVGGTGASSLAVKIGTVNYSASAFASGIKFLATATTTTIQLNVGNNVLGAYMEFDSASLRELYGYHATQSITASRPTLSARYNLLTKTEDFSAWVSGSTSITPNTALAPNGTLTADLLFNIAPTNIYSIISGAGKAGITYTLVIHAKQQSSNTLIWGFESASFGASKLSTLNFTTKQSTIPAGCSINIIQLNDEWLRLSLTCTAVSDGNIVVHLGSTGAYIWGGDLRAGSLIDQYQRVNTATDYDTDPRYFPKYLRFDGIDDYLNLPYMGLYAGGSASVVIAKNEPFSLSANQTILAEGNTATTTPAYSILRYLTVGVGGSSVTDSAVTNFSFSTPLIASACSVESAIDSGNYYTFYRNSVGLGGAPKLTAATTLNNLVLGAVNRGGTLQLYSSMNLYSLIITKSALSDAQRIQCERLLARKAGVAL